MFGKRKQEEEKIASAAEILEGDVLSLAFVPGDEVATRLNIMTCLGFLLNSGPKFSMEVYDICTDSLYSSSFSSLERTYEKGKFSKRYFYTAEQAETYMENLREDGINEIEDDSVGKMYKYAFLRRLDEPVFTCDEDGEEVSYYPVETFTLEGKHYMSVVKKEEKDKKYFLYRYEANDDGEKVESFTPVKDETLLKLFGVMHH